MRQTSFWWVLLVAFASIFCWQAAQSSSVVKDEDAELYRLFVDVVEHVDRSYVQKVDRRKLVQDAIRGMLEDLDPYSDFIAKEQKQQFDRTTTGHFGGIGVSVDIRANEIRVVSPMVGTPAYDAGVRAGDRILKVDGRVIERAAMDEVAAKISGLPGTEVTLTIQHEPYDKNKPIDLKLIRRIINIESVRGWMRKADEQWNYTIDDSKKIAYVRLGGFTANTADDLSRALRAELAAGRVKGLVLDLRNNPGGLLPAAIKVSNLFIKEGKIVSTKGRGQTSERVYNATPSETLGDFPMAVMVNRFSASASEIVAACLQDHHRAVVVGERSWGKGSVQNVIDLEDGKSAIKLTVASYNRPNGHNIHRFKEMTEKDEWGVSPDKGFEVKLGTDALNEYFRWRTANDLVRGKNAPAVGEQGKKFEDQQLDKAVEYVRGKISG